MTIKKYASERREINGIDPHEDLMIGLHKLTLKDIPTFDHMQYILAARDDALGGNKLRGEIFLIDGDIENLKRLIELIKNTDTFSVKVGILLRIMGHTTPLCIEKIVPDESSDNDSESIEAEVVCVYHTDSVIMDIDAGEAIRHAIKEISTVAPVYSLGFEDSDGTILRDCKRQTDEYSCASYSLYDVEAMLEMDEFNSFVIKHSRVTADNLYTLMELPAKFMATIQSIHGNVEAGKKIRNGLQYLIHNREDSQEVFEVNSELTSLSKIYMELNEEEIPNPLIDIINKSFFDTYLRACTRYTLETINSYFCPSLAVQGDIKFIDGKKIIGNKKFIARKIHDLATARDERLEGEKELKQKVEKKVEKLRRDVHNLSENESYIRMAKIITTTKSYDTFISTVRKMEKGSGDFNWVEKVQPHAIRLAQEITPSLDKQDNNFVGIFIVGITLALIVAVLREHKGHFLNLKQDDDYIALAATSEPYNVSAAAAASPKPYNG